VDRKTVVSVLSNKKEESSFLFAEHTDHSLEESKIYRPTHQYPLIAAVLVIIRHRLPVTSYIPGV